MGRVRLPPHSIGGHRGDSPAVHRRTGADRGSLGLRVAAHGPDRTGSGRSDLHVQSQPRLPVPPWDQGHDPVEDRQGRPPLANPVRRAEHTPSNRIA